MVRYMGELARIAFMGETHRTALGLAKDSNLCLCELDSQRAACGMKNIQDRPPGLKISSEIEIFKRATHQTPIFVGNSEGQD